MRSIPNIGKKKKTVAVMVHACKLSTWEMEAEHAEVQAHLHLLSKFKDSLSYLRLKTAVRACT